MISFEVKGIAAVQKQLKELGDEIAVKLLAKAARQAFKPVLDAAKAMVPSNTGALRASLKLSVLKPKGGDAVVVVGLRVGNVKGSDPKEVPPARRWHFVELGTAKMAAHPFARPALDSNAAGVLQALKDELAKGIAAYLAR